METKEVTIRIPAESSEQIREELLMMFGDEGINFAEKITLQFEPEKLTEEEIAQRAAMYLSLCLERQIPQPVDPRSVPEFLPALMDKPLTEYPPISAFTKLPMNITFFHAVLLVEAFGYQMDRHFVSSVDKPFLMQPCIITLRLIAPLPVMFSMDPQTTMITLTFADTQIANAITIQQQVNLAMRLFQRAHICSAQFSNVSCKLFSQYDVKKLSSELGFALLRTRNEINNDMASFTVWALTPKLKDYYLFQSKMKEAFAKVQLFKCSRCKHAYTADDNSVCVFCFHRGNRIPFPDGKMEKVEDGIVYHKYECCGEIFSDSEPCEECEFDQHELNEQTVSSFSTSIHS